MWNWAREVDDKKHWPDNLKTLKEASLCFLSFWLSCGYWLARDWQEDCYFCTDKWLIQWCVVWATLSYFLQGEVCYKCCEGAPAGEASLFFITCFPFVLSQNLFLVVSNVLPKLGKPKGSSYKLLCHMHSGSVSCHCKQCSVWPALLPASACAWNIIHQDIAFYNVMPLWDTCLAWESHQHAWPWHTQPASPSMFQRLQAVPNSQYQSRKLPLLESLRFFELPAKKNKNLYCWLGFSKTAGLTMFTACQRREHLF